MFLRSRSLLPTFLLNYHVWVTSKIQVNFRFNRYSNVLMIVSHRFSQFLLFSMSKNPFLTLLVSYHVWEIPKIQVNFWFKRISEVLIILSYEFLKFLHNSCFWGPGIHWRYSCQAILLGWPRKARSISGSKGSQRYWWLCLMEFRNIFNIYIFKVRE